MANKSILEYEITSPSNTSTVLGEKDGKVKRFNVSDFGGNGSSSGGGATIIDVDEFPSNPSTTAIYRNWQVMKAEWVYKGQIVTDGGMTCEVVDTLPETGNVCYTGASMYSYYQRADGEAYGYVDTALSSQMSVPVGWYPAATLFGALGYAYNGMIDKIADAGVNSFKIEGRMKSPYYVATVINAYRRAIDEMLKAKKEGKPYRKPEILNNELTKASHRKYTTGFMFSDGKPTQNYETSIQEQDSMFMAIVKDVQKGKILVEQRNKFAVGDELEILSPNNTFGKILKVEKMEDDKGNAVVEAKMVQQKLWIYTNIPFEIGDILRKYTSFACLFLFST